MTGKIAALLLILALALAVLPLQSEHGVSADGGVTEVWVATTGSDGNPGTEAQPFATIQKGIDTVEIGDGGTVHVAAGTYYENLDISKAVDLAGAGAPDTIIDGGGSGRVIYISSNPDTQNVISGFTIRNGVSDSPHGGGIYIGETHIVTLNDCVVKDNAAEYGGGIYNTGQLNMYRCTVSGNSAVYHGGGIQNTPGVIGESGEMWLTNCTISDNHLTRAEFNSGGGVWNNGTVTLHNCTIVSNSTSNFTGALGGGFANSSDRTAYFKNCIVANNTSGDGINNNGYSEPPDGIISQGCNIDSENSCNFNHPSDLIGTDPLLGPLQDNGGPTFTHAISQISPAFNGAADGPDHDQRGFTRPMLDGFDIGAYELQRLVPPSITSVNPNSGTQGQTLDVTITGTNFTGATSVRFGALGSYVSVNGFTVDSDTRITASITIMSFASPGVRNVSVTTPAGTGSLNDGFTVTRAGQQTQNVQTATGSGAATFTTNGGSINNLTASAATACGDLEGYSFPHGFFSFNITNLTPGSTVTVTITLPSAIPADSQYWKCINGQWVNVTSLIGDNDGDNLLTLTLTDGGPADADGAANGTIIDPGGPAIAVTPGVQSGASTGPQSSSPSLHSPASQAPVSLPNIYVQSASLSVDRVAPGGVLTVNVGVANRGTGKGSTTIRLYVNGEEDSSRGITLESGD
ncbi:MAG: choice-of-anchor U domain-containing protein, partial [Dehalococcoidia bacterium]